jgi:DNA topoisomerase-1
MAKNLVIVESPAKAKTINKYLGRDFLVKASMGHVRDLPKNPKKKKGAAQVIGGVDVQRGFAVDYEVLPKKRKVVEELISAARDAEAIYLAADPDREGEAICWHLAEALGGRRARKRFRRVVFNEITKRAIEEAFRNPGEVDARKVDAQQTRRILDRLVGYGVSPILWNKVRRGLSAGRVQSVALKLVCDREREIKAFVPEEYWTVLARLLKPGAPPPFAASLAKKDGRNVEIGTAEQAAAVRADLEKAAFRVARVTARERKRNPVPPFTTSKLQQEAFKKLRMPVKKTMQVAQRLYEGIELGGEGSVGLITYMRTDSTRVSAEALDAVRQRIALTYGEDHLPERPNVYRSGKGAQEAHEAIRPTYLDHDPEAVKRFLSKEEHALYKLIWNRFVASQMRPAVYDETAVDIAAGAYLLRARGSVLKFRGFLAVYEESPDEKVEKKPSAEAAEGAEADAAAPAEAPQLPPLAEGDVLALEKVQPDQHFTVPPPRYSEASLVKELEENGIGRPSTYAQIITTIETREYIEKREGKLYPTEVGFVVTDLLSEYFRDIMNVEYTAALEEELDQIEEGKDNLLNTLGQFWKKFQIDLQHAQEHMPAKKGTEETTDETCDKCGKPMVKKWGRYGTFLACSGYPECRNTRQLAGQGEGLPEVHEDVAVEVCPVDPAHGTMVVKKGRFGPFLACTRYPECKATKRLVRGEGGKLQLESVKPLDENCPECGKPLAWRRGRFGPFVACSTYPQCKYIKKKEAREIGLLCPECGQGQVVERKGRWGRMFYGCRRYPECRFTAYHKPLAEPCPSCGRAYLLEKETKRDGLVVFCDSEGCGYERGTGPDAAPAGAAAARKAPRKPKKKPVPA